jgi:trehalose 6-phosphate synthase
MHEINRLIVVSNRLPNIELPTDNTERRNMPVGGLVSALRSALEEYGGIWFGWSGKTVSTGANLETTETPFGRMRLKALDLSRSEASLYYNDFCNRTLWPLLHSFPAKMTIKYEAHRAFRRVNRKFAEVVISSLKQGDVVWVHDFHLWALATELRRLGWDGPIGYFHHVPFPPAEVFGALPWAAEFLEMFLDFDVIGVHTRLYANNLRASLASEVKGAAIGDIFSHGERSVQINVRPIGIEPDEFQTDVDLDKSPMDEFVRGMPSDHKVVLAVDRLDYTKGITQRLTTFEYLLEHYPALRGKLTLIQISAPSRTRVPEYVEERQQIDQMVGHINGRFSEAGWIPIHYLFRSYNHDELTTFFRGANVCLVAPLRDGMNLVAKEFIAAQTADPGVLLLSKFCGAAETMDRAVIINPYDVQGTADAIVQALNMSLDERIARRDDLMVDIRRTTARTWFESSLRDMASTRS